MFYLVLSSICKLSGDKLKKIRRALESFSILVNELHRSGSFVIADLTIEHDLWRMTTIILGVTCVSVCEAKPKAIALLATVDTTDRVVVERGAT